MYHFIDLTDDQKSLRRLILNKYGFVAQLSALSLLVLVALGAWLLRPSPASPRSSSSSSREPKHSSPSSSQLSPSDDPHAHSDAVELTPQTRIGGSGSGGGGGGGGSSGSGPRERSPSARGISAASAARRSEELGDENEDEDEDEGDGTGEERVGLMAAAAAAAGGDGDGERVDAAPSSLLLRERRERERERAKRGRVGAWLDRPVRAGWRETRRQVLCVGLWGVWLVVLVFRETGDDYLHLTKRFAHVAAALLPFHYLLGTPTRLSPLPFLFRVPLSSSYNAYHRLHGVLLFTLLGMHTCFYLNFYFWKSMGWVFGTRVVILGLCMAATLVVLAVMSRENVRKSWRAAFVWTHVLGAGILLVMLWFHVGIARWYVIEAGVVYAAGLYERVLKWRKSRPKH